MSRRNDRPTDATNGAAGSDAPAGIGPHEFKELELMRAGKKPLAMFCDSVPASYDMPEADFAPDVAAGSIVRREEIYCRTSPNLRVFYIA